MGAAAASAAGVAGRSAGMPGAAAAGAPCGHSCRSRCRARPPLLAGRLASGVARVELVSGERQPDSLGAPHGDAREARRPPPCSSRRRSRRKRSARALCLWRADGQG